MRTTIFTLPVVLLSITGSCLGQTLLAAQPHDVQSEEVGFEQAATLQPFTLNFAAMEDEPLPNDSDDGWRVHFNSWVWLMGVEGDIGARGTKADVSADFGDILDASDSLFAFSGRLEFGKGKWGFFIDALYCDLGVDDVSGPLGLASVDITFEETLIDFGVTYRIGEWEPQGEAARNARDISLDLYAGGRYTNLDIEFNPAGLPSRSGDVDWIDPIVGARLILPLAEHWHLVLNGDVGGFGVESDFTWSVTGVFGYDFQLFDRSASVYFGYRAIGQDYTEGSGATRVTWDVVQHGPIVGFSLLF